MQIMFNQIQLSGFSDEISPDFDKQMQVISQLGMKYIEIRGVDGKNITELTISITGRMEL